MTPPSGRSADDHDGHTIVLPHCNVCPHIANWPRKHLVLGTCPRCGKQDPNAWRLAAALALIDGRNDR